MPEQVVKWLDDKTQVPEPLSDSGDDPINCYRNPVERTIEIEGCAISLEQTNEIEGRAISLERTSEMVSRGNWSDDWTESDQGHMRGM